LYSFAIIYFSNRGQFVQNMATTIVHFSGLLNLYVTRFRGQHRHNADPRLGTL